MKYEEFEDAVLRRVFALTLNEAQIDNRTSPPIVHLEDLSQVCGFENKALQSSCFIPRMIHISILLMQELHAETSIPGGTLLLLNRDNAERALMSRLSSPPAQYPQWPIQYLLGCYTRAVEETRSASMLKTAAEQTRLLDTLALIRQLTVSYAGFTVSLGMFPQPPQAEERGALQLLDSFYAAASSTSNMMTQHQASLPLIPDAVVAATSIVPMPPSFLEDFAVRFRDEGLEEILETIGRSDANEFRGFFFFLFLHLNNTRPPMKNNRNS